MMGYLLIHLCFTSFLYGLYSSEKGRENQKMEEIAPLLLLGPFNVLASENESVVTKTIDELNKHAELMDLMGLEHSTFYPINIHINTTQPTRERSGVFDFASDD